MRAPVKAPSTWGSTARRLACWSFFIFFCYWSAEWIADHRGAISQLPLASRLIAAPARIYQHYLSGGKPFTSSTFKLQEQSQPINMGSKIKNLDGLKEHLTHDKLDELRNFWFEHIPEMADRIIAPQELQKRWFFSDKEFDNVCVTRFSPILEAIRDAGVTSAQELLSIAQPRNSLDWLSLIILLDQIPRNSYRGEKSSICFTYFDPIAQQVSLEAIKQGIPDKAPEIRWVFSHRNWFYMPLMHSEDISAHVKAVAAFDKMNQDILSLMEGTGGADEYERKAREVVQADPEAAKSVGETNKVFEEKHKVIIERFGRYPHRNKALGREATPEEVEFLESGGDTFGS
ncbi:Tetratricopeptide-like helical domain superfamily [Fusarium oxysporum f. sp. vasinfectum]|nr:Tetratricopeptide-like helical domain superfamily [Fusarium oxysporum f. sp. vasinfectum]